MEDDLRQVVQDDLVVDLRSGGPRTDPPVEDRTPEVPERLHPRWWRPYQVALVLFDAFALLTAGLVATQLRFPGHWLEPAQGIGVPYLTIVVGSLPVWVLTIAVRRGYDPRCFGLGMTEFRRVANAGLLFIAIAAVAAVAVNAQPARRLVAVALPLAVLLTLLLRFAARKRLHFHRVAGGGAAHRVIVVGEGASREALVERLARSPWSGLRVVGTARPELGTGRPSLAHVKDLVVDLRADTVAVAHSPHVTSSALRELAWELEGTRVDLLLAPALTDVAGPRIQVRPVSGLPLLQLAEPEFDGVRRLVKGSLDRIGALGLIVVLSPVLVAVAALVRLTSPGPAVFRQRRIGRNGQPFTLFKFRSMVIDAESRRAELLHANKHGDGHVLFKMDDDPRVTRVGRVLRRYSLDELPQLFNVLIGTMSLVGPRPPLPSEVAKYVGPVHRRLLVKPGITGLWQVSGRADLDWHETVRLDLYYVENWSPMLDVEILWKTVFAVARGSGAH